MEVITVRKKNHSHMIIDCEPGTAMELQEHFCFYVPGYKFMPAYKNRMWDGKIRLFNSRDKTLYTGLYRYLLEFAKVRDYTVVNEPTSYYGMMGTERDEDISETLESLKLTAGGNLIEPRDYQLQSVNYILQHRQGLLLSPTASGKSLIIYLLARHFLRTSDKKVLLIVPTTSLVEQMYSDFGDYSQYDEWSHEKECHRIYSGKEKFNLDQRIIITTWQSIYKMGAKWFHEYGMVIGDEAHSFKAKSLTSILEKCGNAEFRVGTTGTLDGTQTHQLVLEGLFGPIKKVTTTKELIENKSLSDLDIQVLLLKYPPEECQAVCKMKYQDEMDFIVRYEQRNRFISNLALDRDGNTLVLFQYVEKHGKPLHDMLRTKLGQSKRKLFYVSGETGVDDREKVREITERESNAIIVASLGTFSTGINIKRLHNIIFASPSKSQIKVLQSIGRGLRKSDDGMSTTVYDIADDLHWKNKKNYTLNHAAERIKIYSKEHFDYKVYEINL